jgi:hypothetical protein
MNSAMLRAISGGSDMRDVNFRGLIPSPLRTGNTGPLPKER